MGIEKFFNTLHTSYKATLITPFKKTSADFLFFDFNSIIHKISAQTISDLNYLYKILLVSSNYPSDKLVKYFTNKYKNYENIFHLSIDFLHTPSGISQLITDLKKIDINTIIIYQIIKHIEYYISQITELKYVYISIDGVPSIGKIMEQRHRRYIGEIIGYKNYKKIMSSNFPNKLSEDYPYDYPAYYQTRFQFPKLNISPNTSFMRKLVKSIKNHNFPIPVQINDDSVSGEGEFKIINFIRSFNDLFINKKIIIYSPDSDMILLSSILPHDIYILRFDQQENIDYIMSTEIFKKIVSKYITDKNNSEKEIQSIINDVIFIFSIFGDDFLPRLECIQVNYHYDKILNIYKKIHQDGYILQDDNINLKQMKNFMNELAKIELSLFSDTFNLKDVKDINHIPKTSYLRKKSSSFNYDPLDGKIINQINEDISNYDKLEEKYSVKYYLYSRDEYYKHYEMKPEESSLEYIKGLTWIFNYYFKNKLDYNWYYPYEKAPLIYDLNNTLQKLDSLTFKTEDYPLIMTPIEQSIYTSPIDTTHLLSKNYQSIAKTFYKNLGKNFKNILNEMGEVDCNNSSYLNKCSLLKINHPIYKLSPKEFIKKFRSYSSTNDFLKYVKYYEITNDPYFYDLIKKL